MSAALPHIIGNVAAGNELLSLFDDNFNFLYTTGTFTATLTGVTASITGTANYTIIGNVVTLDLPALLGTSNTTACTVTGLPAAIQPASTKAQATLTTDSNVSVVSWASITGGAGTITLFKGTTPSATGFTNSGVKGLANQTQWTYTLN